jgi:hypothetical protein
MCTAESRSTDTGVEWRDWWSKSDIGQGQRENRHSQ